MGKTYIDTVKYLIYTDFEVHGLVEKPDVVGAIFGQTEGLLGGDLDLRDLQKNGRIGRIEVDLETREGKTRGTIRIPSSLDMVETCIIAAALETVDRVGPCEAHFEIIKIEDTRSIKRKKLIDRAKELLKELISTELPESRELAELVRDEVKTAEVTAYGEDKLPAGPGIEASDEVILVEGRADVINLLKNDITNVAAIGGAKVTPTIIELSKAKETTVFLDGDRGGDIILNELIDGGVEIDYVARAPPGKEVEELTRKEIIKCLRNKVPLEEVKTPKRRYHPAHTHHPPKQEHQRAEHHRRHAPPIKEEVKPPEPEEKQKATKKRKRKKKVDLKKELEELANSLKARFYNSEGEMVAEVAVRDVIKTLAHVEDVDTIVFDGIITQRLADLSAKQGVKKLVGLKLGNVNKKPAGLEIITKDEL